MAAKNSVNGNGSGDGDASGAAEVQRWTAGRKAANVLDIIKGKATPADAARLHGLTVAEVEGWVDKFVEGGKEVTQPENSNPPRVRSLGRTMPRKGPLDETQETHDRRDHQEAA